MSARPVSRASPLTRRAVLAAGAALPLLAGASGVLPAHAAQAPPQRLGVRPRADWGADLPARGRLETERPGDVRFLLVHHTAQPGNDYAADDVRRLLRGIYRYHTSPTKGWPDIAYNFFIDKFGGIWEGRSGSLQAPVKASATGGSQGFALLACYLGDHDVAGPTAAARTSMIALLASLADRYDVDTRPGATASFVSRGSSRWPQGRRVTTPTIAGHRDMSLTSCPGRHVYADLRQRYQADVTRARRSSTSGAGPSPSPSARVTAERGATPTTGTSAEATLGGSATDAPSEATAAAPAGAAPTSAPASGQRSEPSSRPSSGPSSGSPAALPAGADAGFDGTRAAVTGLVAVSAGAAATAVAVARRGR